jgi:micrococcal nuclease
MAATSPATRRTFWGLGIALFLAVLAALALANLQEFFRVKRVIDGDTIMLESGERVHLIGVDTPETDHPKKQEARFGKEASAFTRRMTRGKRVRLEYDPANAGRERKDSTLQKGTMAYVFLEDGTLLNAEIIRQGYGFVLTRLPFSRMEEFLRLERAARTNRRGLWADK